MAHNLFEGLPPPQHHDDPEPPQRQQKPHLNFPSTANNDAESSQVAAAAPPSKPILKSALKRPNHTPSDTQAAAPKKSLKFKTSTDASEEQVIKAMKKITSHIKNPAKVNKAAKLAIQLIQSGSVKSGTSDYFFAMLEAAMLSSTPCTDPSVRADYHSLFMEAQSTKEVRLKVHMIYLSLHLNKKQRNQLAAWTIMAVVANDLYTDDSFVFSKAAGQIKDAISSLPVATKDDDAEEAMSLEDNTNVADEDSKTRAKDKDNNDEDQADPFGLDALLHESTKKGEKLKTKNEGAVKIKEDEEETKRFLKSQREALITCLEIAARRYKTPCLLYSGAKP
nr:uncharacterized protein LOC112710921 isoform X3 [Arachis hypogaea]